jgi:oligopeptide transport system ATP-binding protein
MSAHTLQPVQSTALVATEHLRRVFTLPQRGWDHLLGKAAAQIVAVDDVNLRIDRQTTVALVGESGCGKSTTGRCILGLIPPTSGSVQFDGAEAIRVDAHTRRQLRRKMQIIFQDPYSSLNPRLTAGSLLQEVIAFHNSGMTRTEQRQRVRSLLSQVGLNDSHLDRYPHEFSGGQRQRIGIARALAVEPEFIVCDEPVSALDVSVQAQIINLLEDLQAAHGLTYLFISHDLSVVRHISRVVAVMYLGRIVEQAATEALFQNPHHPYTQALLAAIPQPRMQQNLTDRSLRSPVQGEIAVELTGHQGCTFRNRCPTVMPQCETTPPWIEVAANHWSRCWLDGDRNEPDSPKPNRL